jgi:hypothetical protein
MIEAPALFLDDAELRRLTGRAFKSAQIRWLRQNKLPFRVSATGHPVVTRVAVEGIRDPAPTAIPAPRPWTPRVVGG